MKFHWDVPGRWKMEEKLEPSGEKLEIDKITVSHSRSETFIRFEDRVIVMPPATMKKLYLDLKECLSQWESEHDEIRIDSGKKKRRESVPKKALKALYRSKKIGSKLISINTGKRKHIPLKKD